MRNEKTKRYVTLSMIGAIVIVLQIIASFITIGGFPITLTLVPIIIAGAIYGVGAGSLMGFLFGCVVLLMVLLGVDVGGATMFSLNPIPTVLVCLIKGTLAGTFSALLYKLIKNKKIAIFASSFIAPFTNTVILYLVLILFFESSFAALLSALLSVNFLIELVINVLLAPSLLIIINMRRR